jgi:uncharacterized OB-fold protein
LSEEEEEEEPGTVCPSCGGGKQPDEAVCGTCRAVAKMKRPLTIDEEWELWEQDEVGDE